MGMENKFKVGDKVRCISNEGSGRYTVGQEYVVESVTAYNCGDVLIYCEGVGSGMWPHRFELVSPVWVPKVGDRVVVLDNITPSGLPIKQYEVGKEYAVTGVCKDGNGNDAVNLVGHHQYLRQDQFAKPATLTIEPGKFYKTRDGRKVGPMEKNDRWWTFSGVGNGNPGHYAANGFSAYMGILPRDESRAAWDLIAEWQEPAATAAVVPSAQVDALAEEYGPAKVAASNDNRKLVKTKSGYGFEIARVGNYAWIDTGQKAPITVNISGITDAA